MHHHSIQQVPILTTIPFPENRVALDAYARRHEGQKIYLRQAAAQRWIEWRQQILMGGRPHSGNQSQLRSCDHQLRVVSFYIPISPLPPHSSFNEGDANQPPPTGALNHHRRSHPLRASDIRHRHGPLDGRGPESEGGAAVGAVPETLDAPAGALASCRYDHP